jgi:hypothetical protein
VALVEETVRFQSLRKRSFRDGSSMLVEIGVISRKWNARISYVKVAALRLFHSTVSSILFGPGFYYYDTVPWGERKGVRGR